MKILFCTNTFQNIYHGPAKFANYILEINSLYLEHEVRILTPDVDGLRLKEYHGKVFKLQLKPPRMWKDMISVYRIFPYYRQITRIAKEYEFDIIVFNNAITAFYSAFKYNNVIGMVNDYTSLSTNILTPQLSREWVRRIVFKYLEFISIKKCKYIIVNSKYLANLLSTKYRVPKLRLPVLYKGIDLPEKIITPIVSLRSKEIIKILFVKSDFTNGGLKELVIALGQLPQFNIQLRVVGPQPKFWDEIYQWGQGYLGHLNIKLLGRLQQTEVFRLMKSSDIFCVPARFEALGVANIEAMALGLPVVTTSVGGIPETLDDGNNGWITEPNNPKLLAEIINQCIEKDNERYKKVVRAAKFVEERFSKHKMITEFVRILSNAS